MKDSIIIPIWEKSNLTVEEAAAYSNIGINKLREITNDHRCEFVLWVGNKRLIKRKLFDKYIEQFLFNIEIENNSLSVVKYVYHIGAFLI